MVKTLGQIAKEGAKMEWDDSPYAEQWEAAAQAVREAVIEECINAILQTDRGNEIDALQELKDKK